MYKQGGALSSQLAQYCVYMATHKNCCSHVCDIACSKTSRTSLLRICHCNDDKSTKTIFLQRQHFIEYDLWKYTADCSCTCSTHKWLAQSNDKFQLNNFKLLHLCWCRIWTMDCWFNVLDCNGEIYQILCNAICEIINTRVDWGLWWTCVCGVHRLCVCSFFEGRR